MSSAVMSRYRREAYHEGRRFVLGDVLRLPTDNHCELRLDRYPPDVFGQAYPVSGPYNRGVRAHKAGGLFCGGRLVQIAGVLSVIEAYVPDLARPAVRWGVGEGLGRYGRQGE